MIVLFPRLRVLDPKPLPLASASLHSYPPFAQTLFMNGLYSRKTRRAWPKLEKTSIADIPSHLAAASSFLLSKVSSIYENIFSSVATPGQLSGTAK